MLGRQTRTVIGPRPQLAFGSVVRRVALVKLEPGLPSPQPWPRMTAQNRIFLRELCLWAMTCPAYFSGYELWGSLFVTKGRLWVCDVRGLAQDGASDWGWGEAGEWIHLPLRGWRMGFCDVERDRARRALYVTCLCVWPQVLECVALVMCEKLVWLSTFLQSISVTGVVQKLCRFKITWMWVSVRLPVGLW